MDITLLFKANVKAVRTTSRNLGNREPNKSKLLKISRDNNLNKARSVIKQITELHKFLSDNKSAYLNVVNYLSTNKTMTEIDRQEIDSTAQKIINTCTSEINNYKQEISNHLNTQQKEEHYLNVIDSIEKYLKAVSKTYTEAKAIRVKRVLETHKLSKLETKPSTETNFQTLKAKGQVELDQISEPQHRPGKKEKKDVISLPTPPAIENIENQLSAEEMQMFESENEHLFNELNNLSDEVKQIESKVVHISELQELFTEKVLQQEQDIERIATAVSTSTDNMKDANEQIRQAIQRNAGLRVWVLFFLLVMSFSLLFLDWYND